MMFLSSPMIAIIETVFSSSDISVTTTEATLKTWNYIKSLDIINDKWL